MNARAWRKMKQQTARIAGRSKAGRRRSSTARQWSAAAGARTWRQRPAVEDEARLDSVVHLWRTAAAYTRRLNGRRARDAQKEKGTAWGQGPAAETRQAPATVCDVADEARPSDVLHTAAASDERLQQPTVVARAMDVCMTGEQ